MLDLLRFMIQYQNYVVAQLHLSSNCSHLWVKHKKCLTGYNSAIKNLRWTAITSGKFRARREGSYVKDIEQSL